ncbi:serine/threonine-protein kinase [Paenibacillus chungangensis]|uniref:Serine/threonine-protein kinase n=1 Tax=Paenibacillus chungangensis TaxID=696535 RepID=A0ABW3HN79_9BACL
MKTWQRGDVLKGRYRIERVIGRGGMGVVFAVQDLKLRGVIRAIKVAKQLLPGVSPYSEEAETLMRLNHECLPFVSDYFQAEDGDPEMIVMEYIDGHTASEFGTLRAYRFSFLELLDFALQLSSALVYLHSLRQPIIHRDLKPTNVMIDKRGRVKLIDFGISRTFKKGQLSDTIQLGTAGFAAPEQNNGGQSDARTDIYGLGAVLFYLVSGGKPPAILSADQPIASYPAYSSELPKPFRMALERMLQRKPEHRYSSMAEVREELQALAERTAGEEAMASRRQDQSLLAPQPVLISVVSLASGAGATTLSLALASLLGATSVRVAAAEHFLLRPEWHELLQVNEESSVLQSELPYQAISGRSPHVQWLALHPYEISGNTGIDKECYFRDMLARERTDIHIVDFSSCWSDPQALALLRDSSHLIIVADPFVYKWQATAMAQAVKLSRDVRASGGVVSWAANKDGKFRSRSQWLTLFPEQPTAIIPLVPQQDMLDAVWSRHELMGRPTVRAAWEKGLVPIITIIKQILARNNTVK